MDHIQVADQLWPTLKSLEGPRNAFVVLALLFFRVWESANEGESFENYVKGLVEVLEQEHEQEHIHGS